MYGSRTRRVHDTGGGRALPWFVSPCRVGWLADLLLLVHAGFVAFVVLGGLLLLRWPRAAWLHVPAVIWGVLVMELGLYCPLTPLEQALRRAEGEGAYSGGFVEHYLLPALYPAGLERADQIALGLLAAALNLGVYGALWVRHARRERR